MTDPLLSRIEKLERQNRSMRVAMAGLWLGLGALLTIGQTLPKRLESSLERIEAKEIVLSDGVSSAKLTPGSLVFSKKSAIEAEKATLTASAISLGGRYAMEMKPTGMTCTRDGVPRFDLNVGEIGAAVAFKKDSGLTGTMLDETTVVLMTEGGILSMRPDHIFLQKGETDSMLAPGSLKIRDTEKFQAVLGQVAGLSSKTMNTQSRSAASLTLLGKDDTVLWQAPQ